MPKKSRVDEIIENHPEEVYEPISSFFGYLVFYNLGEKPNNRFYKDLSKLQTSMIQKKMHFRKMDRGLIVAQEINVVYSLMKLIKQYGGKFALYKAERIEPRRVWDRYDRTYLDESYILGD